MAKKSVPRRKTPSKAQVRKPEPVDIEALRIRLFQAHAVVESVRLALASEIESEDPETTLGDALQVASRMIDNVAEALEGARP